MRRAAGRSLRSSWRALAVVLSLSSIVAPVSFAAGAAGAPPAAVLRVAGVDHDLSLLLRIARDDAELAAAGITIELDLCVSGVDCVDRLLDGQFDVVTGSALPVMFAGMAARDVVIVAGIATARNSIAVIGDSRRGVHTAADLVGRRVGVKMRSSAHYVLDMLLLAQGLDPVDVERIDLAADTLPQALEHGDVDAVAVWSPHRERAAQAIGDAAVTIPIPALYTANFNLITTRAVIAHRSDAIDTLLRALVRAETLIADRPRYARSLLDRPDRSDDDVERAWRRLNPSLSIEPSLQLQLRSQARWAVREGYVPDGAAIDAGSLVEPSLLRRVRPHAVSWP